MKTFGIAVGLLALAACASGESDGAADGEDAVMSADETEQSVDNSVDTDAESGVAQTEGRIAPDASGPVERVEAQLDEVDRAAERIQESVAETNRRLDEGDRSAAAIEAEIERIEREQ
jgi:TolA-binding protein